MIAATIAVKRGSAGRGRGPGSGRRTPASSGPCRGSAGAPRDAGRAGRSGRRARPDEERQQRSPRGRSQASPSSAPTGPSSTMSPGRPPRSIAGRRPDTPRDQRRDGDHEPPRRVVRTVSSGFRISVGHDVLDRDVTGEKRVRDPVRDGVHRVRERDRDRVGNCVASTTHGAARPSAEDRERRRRSVTQRPPAATASAGRGGPAHSPAAKVRRSRTIARITIASPASNAAPTSWSDEGRMIGAPEARRADEAGDRRPSRAPA